MSQTKFYLDNAFFKSLVVRMLTVQSYEMNVYLVELKVGKNSGLVYENDRPKRFNNVQQIRDAFENCTVEAAQMLHESPYDEMIGNPESAQKASMLPFSIKQPY